MGKFNDDALIIFWEFFKGNQYPTPADLRQLSAQAGVSVKRLHTWFSNRRFRSRPPTETRARIVKKKLRLPRKKEATTAVSCWDASRGRSKPVVAFEMPTLANVMDAKDVEYARARYRPDFTDL